MNNNLLLFRTEWRLIFRTIQDYLNSTIFFLLICFLFPLVEPIDPKLLSEIAPGIIWMTAILSCLFSLDKWLAADFENGTLTHLVHSTLSLKKILLIKLLCQASTTLIPLLIAIPVIAYVYYLSVSQIFILSATLLLGLPIIFLFGAFLRTIILGAPRPSVLLSLLLLPLFSPILILSTATIIHLHLLPTNQILGNLALLSAGCLFSFTVLPHFLSKTCLLILSRMK